MPATPQERPESVGSEQLDVYTPRILRILASWSWRLILVCAVVVGIWWLGGKLGPVVVPVLLAVMVTAALSPVNRFFVSRRWPRWASAASSMLITLIVLAGLLTLVGTQIASQWSMLVVNATQGFQGVLSWLGEGPLHIGTDQMQDWFDQFLQTMRNSQQQIAGAVATAGSKIGQFFAGAATMLFATFFFLKDGQAISAAAGRMLPDYARETIVRPCLHGWDSLVIYMRAAVTVAFIDGVGAGVGALILGSNMWLAILVLTFILSFVPLLGALTAGSIAVVVVLVTLGPIKAIIMLVIFVAVMSIEAHVLQPMILGRAADIHPLVVLLGISVGSILAGVAGALFAIPFVAFVSGVLRSVHPETQEAVSPQPDSSPQKD